MCNFELATQFGNRQFAQCNFEIAQVAKKRGTLYFANLTILGVICKIYHHKMLYLVQFDLAVNSARKICSRWKQTALRYTVYTSPH